MVQAVLQKFPGAEVVAVRTPDNEPMPPAPDDSDEPPAFDDEPPFDDR